MVNVTLNQTWNRLEVVPIVDPLLNEFISRLIRLLRGGHLTLLHSIDWNVDCNNQQVDGHRSINVEMESPATSATSTLFFNVARYKGLQCFGKLIHRTVEFTFACTLECLGSVEWEGRDCEIVSAIRIIELNVWRCARLVGVAAQFDDNSTTVAGLFWFFW